MPDRARTPSVVLGVPHRDLDPALRFAVREAQVLACDLLLVAPDDAARVGRAGPGSGPAALQRALRTAGALAGTTVTVRGELHPAPAVESALRAHPDATVVVVPRGELAPLLEALGRVVDPTVGVPAVACVPAGWHATETDLPITVAVADPVVSRHLLAVAVGVAARHRLPLRVVHAWPLARPEASPPSEEAMRVWSRRVGEELSVLHASAEVFVNLEIQVAQPVRVLVEQSHESTSLLLGARAPALRAPGGLGSVTEVLLRDAACPVVVVPDAPVSALRRTPRADPTPGA